MKSEPDVFSIDNLKALKAKGTFWDGVRNYQARNYMRDEMKVGDLVLFYHSNAKPPGVAGVAEICKLAAPDPTQFDSKSKYFDPKSTPDAPRWVAVQIKYTSTLGRFVSLDEMRDHPGLQDMVLLKRSRLSVQPVPAAAFKIIEKMGQQ